MKVTLPNGITVDNVTTEDLQALVALASVPSTTPVEKPRLVARRRQNGEATHTTRGDLIMPRGLSDKLREVYTVIVEFGPIHIGEIADLLEIPKEKVSSRLHLLLNQHEVIERVRSGVYQAKTG